MLIKLLTRLFKKQPNHLRPLPQTNHLREDIGLSRSIYEKPVLPPIPYC